MSTSDASAGIFLGFARALRAADVAVTPDRAYAFVHAVSLLGADRRAQVYWAGRATLCSGPDDLATYDHTFEAWFAAEHARPRPASAPSRTITQADLGDSDGDTGEGEQHLVSVLASTEEALRHRDVASLSATERALVSRLFSSLDVEVPMRRGRRRHPAGRGDIDAARTIRDQLHRAGEPGPLRRRRRRPRPRRIVLLIDVSGSMSAYADSLLRLAHRVVMAASRTTEVFTLGTRLTRVTSAMRIRDPEQALSVAGQTVPDWSGGTRLGEVLRAFVDRWGQRGLARGAVVVIASDGWERGSSVLLGEQVERLQRLAHVVLWSNPHRGKDGYAPIQGGIVAALPYLDGLVPGHSLSAFEELLGLVGSA